MCFARHGQINCWTVTSPTHVRYSSCFNFFQSASYEYFRGPFQKICRQSIFTHLGGLIFTRHRKKGRSYVQSHSLSQSQQRYSSLFQDPPSSIIFFSSSTWFPLQFGQVTLRVFRFFFKLMRVSIEIRECGLARYIEWIVLKICRLYFTHSHWLNEERHIKFMVESPVF